MDEAVKVLIVLSCLTGSAAYSSFRHQIPNGDHVPHPCKPNYLWHGVGHQNPLGGGIRNSFGIDFKNQGYQWTSALCAMDSDGDGLTNGQELGDPDCVWTPGQIPQSTTGLSHPGVCDPFDSEECRQKNSWVDCAMGELACDAINEPETRNITLRIPTTAVPNKETNYMCMTFDLPSDAPYHLVASLPYIDNTQVMHHIILFGCTDPTDAPLQTEPEPCGMGNTGSCGNIIGGWTVGSPGRCSHPNTGFLIGLGGYTRVRMQFHWNNPELRSDYTDASGLTLYYTPKLRENNLATFTVGQVVFEIPPRQPSVFISGSCPSSCSRQIIRQPIYVHGLLNHMHYLGRSQKVEVLRDGSLVKTLVHDQQYSYDNPVKHVLEPPFQLLPGDEIKTTCEYSSTYKTSSVFFGDGTSDEMCFAFMDVYPAESLSAMKMCVGMRSQSVCDVRSGNINGCNLAQMRNASHPDTVMLAMNLKRNCNAFGSCRPECRALLTNLADHPCLQGEAYEFLKDTMKRSHEGTLMLAMLESCRDELNGTPQCPKCQQCDTGGAPTLTSSKAITMAALSVFVLWATRL